MGTRVNKTNLVGPGPRPEKNHFADPCVIDREREILTESIE